jgi:hypothetical protein
MRGAILPLPQYAFMAECSVKAHGQLLPLPCTGYEGLCYRSKPFLHSCKFSRFVVFRMLFPFNQIRHKS